MLSGKTILLIIGGGIAAYKSLDLIRQLRGQGAEILAVLTRAGAEFVTPLQYPRWQAHGFFKICLT